MNIDSAMSFLGENWEMIGTGVSVIFAGWSGWSARKATKRMTALQWEKLRTQIDAGSLSWGTEAINAMSDACGLSSATWLSHKEFEARREQITSHMSALIDRGRLYFPNLSADGHGAEKETAFQGKRPPILDALVYAYYETLLLQPSTGESAQQCARFIVDCRRLLVSELQDHLDPRRLNELVGRKREDGRMTHGQACDRAGELGHILNTRRHGYLTKRNDDGWMDRIGPEKRETILTTYGSKPDEGRN